MKFYALFFVLLAIATAVNAAMRFDKDGNILPPRTGIAGKLDDAKDYADIIGKAVRFFATAPFAFT